MYVAHEFHLVLWRNTLKVSLFYLNFTQSMGKPCEVCNCNMWYFRHLVLLECVLDKLDDPNSCVVPDHLTDCNSSCCINAKDITFLAKKFQCSITAISGESSRFDVDHKISRLLLQLINTMSLQSSNLKILQQLPRLLESTIGMYILSDNCAYYSLLCHTKCGQYEYILGTNLSTISFYWLLYLSLLLLCIYYLW